MNQKVYKQPLRERNQVELKCTTWEKDSHGLFDYESTSVQTEKHRVENPCQIVRQDNKQIKIVDYNERIEDENTRVLACITQKDLNQPSYFINPISQSTSSDSNTSGTSSTDVLGNKNSSGKDSSNNDAYLIVRFLRNQKQEQKGYPLQVGDMIKLGRVEYCIIEKYTEEHGLQQINDIFCDADQYNFNIDYTKNDAKTCRICLCEEEQCIENPLLNPCNCKGSCEYMHYECLKHWVESKIHKKSSQLISTYKWKNLECEVCKQPLPKIININNRKLSLVEVPRPEGPYIILESISREKKVSMGLYIIHNLKNEDDQAKLGRGHTCDIRVQDISVSRFHSYIKYENGQFLLFDNSSKFGTLVKLDKNYPILSEKVGIQVGRTVITFSLKPPNSGNMNQLQQSIQQSVAQFDRVTMNNSQKQKQIQEQQQQLLTMAQQFKNVNIPTNFSTTTTTNVNNSNGLRIPTNQNIPSSTSTVNNNNNLTSTQQQKNNIQSQLITSTSAVLDKLQKNNSIKQPNKGNTFVSNAANNIIGNSNPSQVQGGNANGINNRANIQTLVMTNGSMTNFNATQYKMNDMPIMNNFSVVNNTQTNNNNNGMYSSSHVMGQNNRNSSNTTHYNEFPNYNSMIYNQGNYHNIQTNHANNFTSTLYNNNNITTNIQPGPNNNNPSSSGNSNHTNYNHYSVQQPGSTLISRNNRNHH